ncbi:MAG: NAD(P)H-dependent oxidoreductase [Pseudomonadota bacterium]
MSNSTLVVTASAAGAQSVSRKLALELAETLGGPVTLRDVSGGLPVVDADFLGGREGASTKVSAVLIAELRAHDRVILAAPMYNFGVPAALKSWIDLVARAGQTFRYTETGPEGLLTGKTGYVVVTTGGTPAAGAVDFTTPYLVHILAFLGIRGAQVVTADRMVVDANASLATARGTIRTLASHAAA